MDPVFHFPVDGFAEERLQGVLRKVFQVEALDDTASPETVKGWDSLRHLALICELEEAFGIAITTAEVTEMVNVRAIKEILRYHDIEI